MTYWFVSDVRFEGRLKGDGRGRAYAVDLVNILLIGLGVRSCGSSCEDGEGVEGRSPGVLEAE